MLHLHVGESVSEPPTTTTPSLETPAGPPPTETIADPLGAYLETMRLDGRTEQTVNQHRSFVADMLEHAGADLRTITAEQIVAFLRHIQEHGRNPRRPGKGVTGKSLNTYRSALKKMFDWCVRRGVRADNPASDIGRAKEIEPETRVMTPEELRCAVAAAEQDEADPITRHRHIDGQVIQRSTLYRFLAETGLRYGAALSIRWADVRLDQSPPVVHVRGNAQKTRRDQIVPLSRDCADMLRAMRRIGTDPEAAVWRFVKQDLLVDDCCRGGVHDADTKGWRIGWHSFRRMTATELAKLGVSPKVAQMRLGHKNVGTTLKYYTRVEQRELIEPVARLARQLAGTGGGENPTPASLEEKSAQTPTQEGTCGAYWSSAPTASPKGCVTEAAGSSASDSEGEGPFEPSRDPQVGVTGFEPVAPPSEAERVLRLRIASDLLRVVQQILGPCQSPPDCP